MKPETISKNVNRIVDKILNDTDRIDTMITRIVTKYIYDMLDKYVKESVDRIVRDIFGVSNIYNGNFYYDDDSEYIKKLTELIDAPIKKAISEIKVRKIANSEIRRLYNEIYEYEFESTVELYARKIIKQQVKTELQAIGIADEVIDGELECDD